MCLAMAPTSTQKRAPETCVFSCRSEEKTVYSQHKNVSVDKERFPDEDSTSPIKESSYGQLFCFRSLPCSGELQWKYGTPSTKVLGGRDDIASSKFRHTSAAFNDLRHCENHSKMYLRSIRQDKKDIYQKDTDLKYIDLQSCKN